MPGKPDWAFQHLKVTGGQLGCHRTGGSGPALALSHGLTDNGLCWFRLAEALAGDFDVIMLDARGHGQSSAIDDPSTHDPARDIAEALDALNLESPIVMGHSVGGRATADFAGTWPGRASRVVLEDPIFIDPMDPAVRERRQERFRQQVAAFSAQSEAEILAAGRLTNPGWHEDDFPAWAEAKRVVDPEASPFYAHPWQETVARIDVPVLLIRGEPGYGGVVSPDIAAEARALNPLIESVEIPGAGHNIRRENFTDYLTAVRGFLLAAPEVMKRPPQDEPPAS